MRRRIALLLLPLLVGCSSAAPTPTPAPEPAPVQTPAPITEPAPVTATPAPCRDATDQPNLAIGMGAAVAYVQLQSCALEAPAGDLTLDLRLTQTEHGAEVQVEGAPAGAWTPEYFRVTTKLLEGERQRITLTVKGREPVTLSLHGIRPLPFLSYGNSNEGPWTTVTAGGVIPESATWLLIRYPRPMQRDQPSPYRGERYGRPEDGIPGEWVLDRAQLIQLTDLPKVLFGPERLQDQEGLTLYWQAPRQLYRGDAPTLIATTPGGGERTLHTFDAEPAGVQGDADRFTYATTAGAFEYSPATGSARPVAMPQPLQKIPSPDGRFLAAFRTPAEGLPHPTDGRLSQVDLLITEAATGKVLLEQTLSTLGAFSCSRQWPGFGWRADSQAFAVLDAPAADRLQLKEVRLTGESRIIAEQRAEYAATKQWESEVNWSPDGKLIAWAGEVVQVADGKRVAQGVNSFSLWAPDGRHLLQYDRRHPFTQWGVVELLDLSTGQTQTLANGVPLGWNAAGEALWIKWTVEAETPPPAKGCP